MFADFPAQAARELQIGALPVAGQHPARAARSVREQMNGVRLAGGDTMNYWINDFRPQLLDTLKDWDFLLINDSEARLLSGETT